MSIITETHLSTSRRHSYSTAMSIRDWLKKCLKENVESTLFENGWADYVSNNCNPTAFVPGEDWVGNRWKDDLKYSNDIYDMSRFYDECRREGANYIRVKIQYVDSNSFRCETCLVGERRGMAKKNKKRKVEKGVKELTRFEIMDFD